MGTTESQSNIVYNVPIQGSKQKGFSPIYRSPKALKQFVTTPDPKFTNFKDVIYESVKNFKDRDCMGQISLKLVNNEGKIAQQRELKKFTYGQVFQMAEKVGSFLLKNKLEFIQSQNNMKVIGIFCKNRYEWSITDIACALYGITIIPLYQTLGVDNLSFCLEQSGITSLFVSDETAKTILKLKKIGNLQNLIIFDKPSPELQKEIKQHKFKFFLFESALNQVTIIDHKEIIVKPQDCLIFSYTSGTTGPPKGAMISHANFLALLGSLCIHSLNCFNETDSYVSFLPLPHLLERSVLFVIIFRGAFFAFYSGDFLKIKDDFAFIKPTILIAVPRIYNRIVQSVKNAFEEQKACIKSCLISNAVSSKIQSLHKNGQYKSALYDNIIFSKVKQKFGGRIRLMITGSAPIKKEVFDFMKILMSCPFYEAYGQTENTAGATCTQGYDIECEHVGGIVGSLQLKLCDVQQMHYTSDDKDDKGNPTPRGEIWLRGPSVFMGYYKDKAKTNQTITPDGWLKTGDIGMILPVTRALKIIDRKKNIFKLQQGEYVASQKVQAVYGKSYLVSQVFLHGQSLQNYAVAIIVPRKDQLMKLAQKHNINGTFQQVCNDKNIRIIVNKQIDQIGKQQGLMSFQQAKNIWLDPEPFVNRSILSSTLKLQRFAAKKYYEKQIDTMYQQGPLVQK